MMFLLSFFFFFFNDTATTEIYTLSLHDALPISTTTRRRWRPWSARQGWRSSSRSEEHTSELQSLAYLVCRLLLEKKKNKRPREPAKKRKVVEEQATARGKHR